MLELNTLWRVIPFVEIFCKFLVWAFNLAMGFTHWNKALVWCIAGWVAFVWNVGDTLMDYSSKNVMNQLDKRWTVVKIMIAWHHSAFIRLRSRRKSIYNVSLLIKQNWYFKYFENSFRYFLIEQYSIKKKIFKYFKHFTKLSPILSTFFSLSHASFASIIPSLLVTLLIPLSRSQHREYPKTYSKSKQTVLSYSRCRYFRPRTAIHFARQIHQSRGKNFLLSPFLVLLPLPFLLALKPDFYLINSCASPERRLQL